MQRFIQLTHLKHIAKKNGLQQPEFLVLGSEPSVTDFHDHHPHSLYLRNRYLAKRRVMRNIKRLRSL